MRDGLEINLLEAIVVIIIAVVGIPIYLGAVWFVTKFTAFNSNSGKVKVDSNIR